MKRSEQINRLKNEHFDICIIGGGASGTGCALDAALRGFKVALIEKTDFAAGTSSKSTKLIHGGVRYLEQAFKNRDFAQLKQVKHGLEERHIVLSNAPHLARPLGLITPVFSWIEGMYFTIGLKMYGFFASKSDILPKSDWLNKAEVMRRMPTLNPKLHSAVLYYDGQLDDARYCLALAQSAHEAGAAVANHIEVLGFQKDTSEKLTAANLEDTLSGEKFELKATLFINCTGPYSDPIRTMANTQTKPRIRPSKGVHLVLPFETLNSNDAMLIPKTKDGRVVFAIPFEGKMMLGTTDDDYNDLEKEPLLEEKEVDYLLETLQPYLAKKVDKKSVISGFGGLRPLITASSENTKSLLRDHEVEHDKTSNLISLLGGKWTTYRLMAKDTIDLACQLFVKNTACSTEKHVLAGGEQYNFEDWKNLRDTYSLEEDTCKHLMQKYGSRAKQVADLTKIKPELSGRLDAKYPFIKAEIEYAAKAEMACTLRDFLARRLRLEISDWHTAMDVAPVVAYYMGEVLGWTEQEKLKNVSEYVELLKEFEKEAGQ